MTNYQINTLEKILKQNGVTETHGVLAGENSGWGYIIANLSAENRVHIWFALNTTMTEEKFKTGSIWGVFLPSRKIDELVAFLQIPESNPAR